MLQSDIYNFASVGYLVVDGKVLLVLHKKFKKWVPPGGHVERNETFAEAAEREFFEETSLKVSAVSLGPLIHGDDSNATMLPLPFYTDVLKEGFQRPTICHYYFMKLESSLQDFKLQIEELDDFRWFTKEDLLEVPTFDQVRSLAVYALENYPKL